ncbi:MAG: hypothetical protein VZR09_07425 [Candidatus Gastranaerophilaceae bacterium]|nr:hypothetical protein [Candidatus Gastranaerophilaceae bacterium]
MKKFVLLCSIILSVGFLPAYSVDSEMIEDYMDIVSNDCILGDYADAVKYLDKVMQLDPQNKEFKELKDLLYQLGTQNQKSFITGYNADLDRAMAYKRLGDSLNQGTVLKEAAKKGNFWVYNALGDYFRDNKEYKSAVEAYFTAYQLEPSFTQALLSIAACYLELGEYELVNEPVRRFLYFNQQSDLAYALRAKAYLALHQLNDAETEIVTALALKDDIEYQFIHGMILYRKGNYNKAIQVLNKVAEEVQTAEVFKYLGLSYLGKKEYSNAMLNLDKAIILSDDDKELKQKYNETRELIKNINTEKLQNEERTEVKNIYESEPKTEEPES